MVANKNKNIFREEDHNKANRPQRNNAERYDKVNVKKHGCQQK
jgi:hypothetical protein